MKVCSTYYDNVPNLESGKYTLVRVSCAEPPAWFMESYDHVNLSGTFGPTPQMLVECHPAKDWETFVPRYEKEILGVLDKTETKKLLHKIWEDHEKRPLLLICYEAPPENCHRHLIGGFLGIDVQEV